MCRGGGGRRTPADGARNLQGFRQDCLLPRVGWVKSPVTQHRAETSDISVSCPFWHLLVVFQTHPLKTNGVKDVVQGSFVGVDAGKARVCLEPESIGDCRLAVHVS